MRRTEFQSLGFTWLGAVLTDEENSPAPMGSMLTAAMCSGQAAWSQLVKVSASVELGA